MVKIDDWNDPKLMEAILIWTGYGDSMSPRRDSSMVVQRFGSEATKWISLIELLEDEFYESKANFESANMQEMSAMVIADFRKKYPEVPDEITKALAWCYTFDNR
ncbi:hypothetical protein Hneap_0369 [Halothiobacillus neapolitanus c2]|uniref:Uncharacterized protein n=1 Tax=Halothiobacillus neapolitanus (strain ATCC 23641 / DSM 15147 / CIP 104769 / NCIMB 8539 / c2) TaxID=555778 RepID=D0KXQ7_HALNC|nr:hypothetical protein Hneap_0369 [Halothiobacillus neapolitanus c2]TDN57197.1 hypothetical protein C8D83_1192 [Halothiobacillus neapolitanus]